MVVQVERLGDEASRKLDAVIQDPARRSVDIGTRTLLFCRLQSTLRTFFDTLALHNDRYPQLSIFSTSRMLGQSETVSLLGHWPNSERPLYLGQVL